MFASPVVVDTPVATAPLAAGPAAQEAVAFLEAVVTLEAVAAQEAVASLAVASPVAVVPLAAGLVAQEAAAQCVGEDSLRTLLPRSRW